MTKRFLSLMAAILLAGAIFGFSPAGHAHKGDQAEPTTPIEPPAKLPRPPRGDPTKNLDFLFEALKIAPDSESAKLIEQRIWALWYVSGSATADLLMSRVKSALDGKDADLALEILNSLVEVKPDYVEGWNRRATIYFMQKDFGAALADIRQVLAREPRHFGALSGLGMIMQEIGDEKRALEVFRRALEVYPRLEKIPDIVKTLQEKVEGRDI
jgi:tetratricopeptide (TPR) repeat protein